MDVDRLVDNVFSIKDFFQDGFLVLPHLLSGFFFFIGIFTSNIGMLCLMIGHLIIVPSLSFFANREWSYFTGQTSVFNWREVGISLIPASILSLSLINWVDLSSVWGITIPIIYLIKALLPMFFTHIESSITMFDAMNPYVWLNGTPKKKEASNTELCYLSPEEKFVPGQGAQRRTPSGWTIHILFFFGFLMANAYGLYSKPAPNLVDKGDSKINAANKEQLDARVKNRKLITGMILAISSAALLLILYVRLTRSSCEDSVAEIFFPMVYCLLFGVAWYTVLTEGCGLSSTDILGLVQGFISPDLINNPIVCVGTDSNSRST